MPTPSPSPSVSPREEKAPRGNDGGIGEGGGKDPTNGGCSGNAPLSRPSSPKLEAEWRIALRSAAATEAALGWASDEGNAKQEDEDTGEREINRFMAENALQVTSSYWMAQNDPHPQ